MPFAITRERQFVIKEIENCPEITEVCYIAGAFREASAEEAAQRDEAHNVPVSQDAAGTFTWQSLPFTKRQLIDIFYTLKAIEFVDDEDTASKPPVNIRFENGKVSMTLAGFLKEFGKLPKRYVSAIYAECLKANPDWSNKVQDTDEGN